MNPVKVNLYNVQSCQLVLVFNIATSIRRPCTVVDAGLEKWRRILGIEASQWPVCLQYGGHMSNR